MFTIKNLLMGLTVAFAVSVSHGQEIIVGGLDLLYQNHEMPISVESGTGRLWVDAPMATVRSEDGQRMDYYVSTSAGMQKFNGTLFEPFEFPYPPKGFWKSRSQAWPYDPELGDVSVENGGVGTSNPYIMNIYKMDGPIMLGFVHLEDNSACQGDCYNENAWIINENWVDAMRHDQDRIVYYLGLALSLNGGETWDYLYDFARNTFSGIHANIGGAPYMVLNRNGIDYFYVYYNHRTPAKNNGTGVVRAPVQEVVDDALSGDPQGDMWEKYDGTPSNDGFNSNPLTDPGEGLDLPLHPAYRWISHQYDSHTDAAFSSYLQKGLLLISNWHAGYDTAGVPWPEPSGLLLYTTQDGVNFSQPTEIHRPIRDDMKTPYPTIVNFDGGSRDCRIVGQSLHVMFPESRYWHDSVQTGDVFNDLYLRQVFLQLEPVSWVETFSQDPGVISDHYPTSWTASRSGGSFNVQNGRLTINNGGGEGVLNTGVIDISGGPVDVSLDLESVGPLESHQDYVKLFAKVDGGAEILIGEKWGVQAATSISGGNISGNTLELVIRTYVSYGNEYYHMDNLSVTGNQLPTVSITAPASGSTFLEGSSISVQATASDPDGQVSQVELYASGNYKGTVTGSGPYQWSLTGLRAQIWELEAKAIDDKQAQSWSSVVPITVYNPGGGGEAVPWIENFPQANGTTSDGAPTSWNAIRSSGILSVQNGKLTVNSGGTEGVLTTGDIDISSGPVDVSLDLVSQGGLENYQDYVKLFAKVDGGAEMLIGEKWGVQAATSISGGNISGNTLELVIRTYVSYGNEYYYMDNLSVTGGGVPNPPPTVMITSPTAGQQLPAGTTSWNVTATAFDDGNVTQVEFFKDGISVGTDFIAHYSKLITGLSNGGAYSVYAIATDNENATTQSATINFSVASGGGGASTIEIEAECASGQTLFSPLSVVSDGAASGGQAVRHASTGSLFRNPSDNSSGQMIFTFNTTQSAMVDLDMRVNLPTSYDDSYYWKIDNGGWNTQNNTQTSGYGTITHALGTLGSGAHTLRILRREDGARIDKLTLSVSSGSIVNTTTCGSN